VRPLPGLSYSKSSGSGCITRRQAHELAALDAHQLEGQVIRLTYRQRARRDKQHALVRPSSVLRAQQSSFPAQRIGRAMPYTSSHGCCLGLCSRTLARSTLDSRLGKKSPSF